MALVISDLNLPDVNGIELCRELACRWPGLPTAVSTGYLTDDTRAAVLAAGVRRVIPKEQTLELLVDLVVELLPPTAGTDLHRAG